jgi:hypothetical protein
MFLKGIGFLPHYFFYIAFSCNVVLFCLFSVLFLCICTVFMYYLRLYTGFIIGTCAVKPAR